MTQLAELDTAVMALNELWQVCTDDDQCDQLLDKRDALDDQAQELANRIIREGTNEFHAAISALNDLTRAARSAKKEVDDIAKKITKTATAISKATTAISKVAVLLA
jgi:uncharacterized coiled-coil DUF342 family protein